MRWRELVAVIVVSAALGWVLFSVLLNQTVRYLIGA